MINDCVLTSSPSARHLSDAISLLSPAPSLLSPSLPAPSPEVQLYLAICHISKLDVEAAATVLEG